MKVWKDRQGNWITAKEFATRFKSGLEGVTPLQHTKSSLLGLRIVFIGIIWGIIMSAKLRQWWLFIILLGSFIVSGSTYLGTWQKKRALEHMQEQISFMQKIAEKEVKDG